MPPLTCVMFPNKVTSQRMQNIFLNYKIVAGYDMLECCVIVDDQNIIYNKNDLASLSAQKLNMPCHWRMKMLIWLSTPYFMTLA